VCTPGCTPIVLLVTAVKLLEIGFDAFLDLPEELFELVLGELELAAIDGHQLA
jgi:hypothetical protein